MSRRFVLVTGARDWPDDLSVWDALMRDWEPHYLAHFYLLHGACPRGADAHANSWAEDMCGADVQVWRFPADWSLGRGAGHIRNTEMVREMKARQESGAGVQVLAFPTPTSRGTWNCVRSALHVGLPVKIDWSCVPGGAWLPAESSPPPRPPLPPTAPKSRPSAG